MSDDVLITPASRKIEFKDNSGNVDGKIELDSSGNLKITSPGGGLELGDAASDIFVGNGTANIDIIFEQNGEIRGTTGRTVTLGQSDSNIAVNALNFTSGGNEVMTSASVFPSGTTTTGLPTAGALNLANPVENDNHVFHPYLNNDLGHFVERGGTYAWGGLSSNPSADSTKTMFNASGDFCSINDNTISGSTYTLTLTNLPKGLSYSSYAGIVFCHDTFSPGSMVIETSTNNGSSWTTRLTDSSSKAVYACTFDTGGTSTNAIRFTLTAAPNSAQVRIQSITAYNYQSAGMENYFLPLDGGTVYGDVTLPDNNKLNFGTSSDLRIYHDGSNSIIEDVGTGSLQLKGAVNINGAYTLPSADGNNAQVLATNGSGTISFQSVGSLTGSGIQNVSDDTSPQLGGNLATAAHNIQFGDSSGSTDDRLQFGASQDLQIYHNGSNSYIDDGSGTGALIFKSNTYSFRNAADDEQIAVFNEDGAVELYYNGSKKFQTRSNGFAYIDDDVNIEITNQANFGALEIGGSSGAFIDLKSPETDDYDARIQLNTSNNLSIFSDDLHLASKTAETYLDATANGAVNLYYDNSKKFETSSAGATITGALTTTEGITVTGGNSGDVLLTFDTDRSWQFQQSNDNASTRLQLKSNVGSKFFDVVTSTGNAFASFYAHDTTPSLTLTSTNADATAGPTINLTRDSASPAYNDLMGELVFKGDDSAGNSTEYAVIRTKIASTTNGSEGGNLSFNVMQGGSETEFLQMAFNNLYVNKQLTMFNNIFLDGNYSIKWDGSTNDSNTTSLVVTDPTAVRTITLPDATGQVVLSSGAIDTDASAEIGRAHVGYVGWSDLAGFSHVDFNTQTSYSLLQGSTGITYLNAANGQTIKNRINNNTIFETSATGLTLSSGKVLSSPTLTLTASGGITFSDGTTQTSAGASTGFSIAMATALG